MELRAALTLLSRDPDTPLDLAELALHLARDEYPDLDVDAYLSELAGVAQEARAYVAGHLERRVTGLCRYLFHEMGFHGNVQDYYDPRNSYLNQVFDRRTGIPITLSIMAIAVGVRVGLPVVGVGLPGHFVAKVIDGDRQILFDPFHGGRLLTPESCETLVERTTGDPFVATAQSLAATSTGQIALRMLSNLKGVYLRREEFAKAARVIERLRQLAPDDLLQRRDLGVTLMRAGQPARAIDHLAAYLADSPAPDDAKVVIDLLTQARGAVAQWN